MPKKMNNNFIVKLYDNSGNDAEADAAAAEDDDDDNNNNTHRLTINGCLTISSIAFSLFTCSTCFNRITSAIGRIFNAKYSLVGR